MGREPFSYPIGPHWFVVYSNIKCERRAQAGLDGKGFRTFLPITTKWVTHARVKTIVKRPLMSRYFFVELDPNRQSFEDVRQTDGVESIVSNCGIPAIAPRKFVEAFIQRQLAGEFDYANKEPMGQGAKVKVVSGEFDEMLGVILSGSTLNNGAVMVKLLDDRRQVRLRAYALRGVET